ncbi:MAG TPA: hypothetical protein VNB90_00580 [Cytophagaceae bacterium]|nr:hypothetical protein [Cytophagaceae bacterium]
MKKTWIDLLYASLLYTLVFIVYTFPLILKFDQAFIGELHSDAPQFFWNAWHFKKSFFHPSELFHTHDLLYPQGISLLVNSNTYIYGIAALFCKNPYFSFNLIVALSFVLSGLGAYVLAKKYLDSRGLCLLAGFIFAFSPYKLVRLTEHYNLILTFTIPWIFLCFTQLIYLSDRKITLSSDLKKYGAFFLLFAFTVLLDYLAVFHAFYLCTAYFIALILLSIKLPNAKATFGIVVIFFLTLHFVIRGLRLLGVDDRGAFWWGGDLTAYFVPSYQSLFFYNDAVQNIYASGWFYSKPFCIESVVFLGYSFIIVSVFAFIYYLRNFRELSFELRALFITLVLLAMMSIPSFRLFGKQLFNMPTSIIHFIPFFNNVRIAGRIIMLVSLVLPILSFYYLEKKIRSLQVAPVQVLNISTAVLGLFLFFEYYPSRYQFSGRADLPEFVYNLEKKENTSILNIPLGVKDGNKMLGYFDNKNLFFQTAHGLPITDGYASRIQEKVFLSCEKDPGMNLLFQYSRDTSTIFEDQMFYKFSDYIKNCKVNYIIISPTHRNQRLETMIYNKLMIDREKTWEDRGYRIIKLK